MQKKPFSSSLVRLDADHPLARGLVLCVPFFEGPGNTPNGTRTAMDHSSMHNLVLPVNKPRVQGGPWGSEMYNIAANSSYFNCGNASCFTIPRSFTVMVSYKLTTIPASAHGMQLLSKDKDVGGRSFAFDVANANPGNGIRFYLNGDGSNVAAEGRVPVIGDDRVATGTCDYNGFLSVYVNGILTATANGAVDIPVPISTANLTIGAREFSGFQEYIDGQIRFAYMWNRVLSQGEIYQMSSDPWAFFRPTVEKRFMRIGVPSITTSVDRYYPGIVQPYNDQWGIVDY